MSRLANWSVNGSEDNGSAWPALVIALTQRTPLLGSAATVLVGKPN